jgi:hypothetical protein
MPAKIHRIAVSEEMISRERVVFRRYQEYFAVPNE